MRETFDAGGPLASVDVLAAICGIGRRKESGTLSVAGPAGESVRLGFAEGALVALDPPAESGPADVLIRGGKIQRATYEALTVGDFEDRFAVAVASGVISRREANWGLKISAIESLVRVLSWTEGEYAWEEGDPKPTTPPLNLRIDQWVLELFLRSNDRGFVVRKIGPPDVPVARAEGFAESFAALGLTADADAVVEGVDGRRTIDEIVKRSRADEFATLKLLAALITLGLVLPIHELPDTAEADTASAPDFAPMASSEPPPAPEEPWAAEPDAFELEPAAEIAPEPISDPEPPLESESAAPSAEAPEEEPSETPWEPEATEAEGEEVDAEHGDGGERTVPEAEESVPEPPTRDPAREISVPLFALTAPEAEPAPEADSEPPESLPEGKADSHRRLGSVRVVALLAALALAAVLIAVRRRATPTAPETATPPATAPSNPPVPPAAGAAATEPPPRTSSALPEPHPDRSPERRAAAPPAPLKASPERRAKKGEPAGSAAPAKNESWEALARAGRKAFEHPGAHRYAIQLELACEGSTLEKAFAADPGRRQIWIAAYPFRGRSCYRVLWGKYRDLDSAKAAKSAVPEMFSHDGNHPAVVSLGRAK